MMATAFVQCGGGEGSYAATKATLGVRMPKPSPAQLSRSSRCLPPLSIAQRWCVGVCDTLCKDSRLTEAQQQQIRTEVPLAL